MIEQAYDRIKEIDASIEHKDSVMKLALDELWKLLKQKKLDEAREVLWIIDSIQFSIYELVHEKENLKIYIWLENNESDKK